LLQPPTNKMEFIPKFLLPDATVKAAKGCASDAMATRSLQHFCPSQQNAAARDERERETSTLSTHDLSALSPCVLLVDENVDERPSPRGWRCEMRRLFILLFFFLFFLDEILLRNCFAVNAQLNGTKPMQPSSSRAIQLNGTKAMQPSSLRAFQHNPSSWELSNETKKCNLKHSDFINVNKTKQMKPSECTPPLRELANEIEKCNLKAFKFYKC
jgi:hypothetical protein